MMTKVLGYEKYIVAGGDHGGLIAGWMARDYPKEVLAQQQHMFYPRHAESPWQEGKVGPNPTKAEQSFVDREKAGTFDQMAYILTHVARGETLGAALHDSPVGQLAWIAEKWHYWTDRRGKSGKEGPLDDVVPPERILDEVMVYIATDSFRTSLWPYIAIGQENVTTLKEGEKIANPCGVTAWPDPVFPLPPKEYVLRSRTNLIHNTTPAKGGHFPMVEQPTLFVEDMRQFGAAVRKFYRK